MAQLNDLLVSGASRLLNGLGILGTTNADSIIPNITETYELGSSSKKWKTAYVKTISANDMTLAILTVTNYATIGGGQAATAANTGALRVAGGLSATQNSFFAKSIITTPGNSQGIKVNAAYITAADSANGEIVLQGGHLRFGGSSWDYNYWAGLKYDHSVKTVYLGIADNSIFKANAAQSSGTLALPGVQYFSVNGKEVINAGDAWLRINQNKTFSSGTYFGQSIVRTDNQFQVGDGGNKFYANSSGNGYFSNTLGVGGTNTNYKIYTNGKTKVGDGANSTSASTGGLQVAGGIGVSGNSWFGGTVTATKFIGPLQGNANSASMLYTDTLNVGMYASSDTHILKLGYWNCGASNYENLVLLITSSFWGNQHGSSDIISIRQDMNDNSTGHVQCTLQRTKLMNSTRVFYYKIDDINKRIYLYVYVTGGNSYGKWSIATLEEVGNTWVTEYASNQTKDSTFVTIEETKYEMSTSADKLATSRSFTIGNTSRSFNGTANVSWTVAEIGAATTNHTHGLLHSNFNKQIDNTTTDSGWSMINSSYNGFMLMSLRTQANAPAWIQNNFAAGVAFGGADTKGVFSVAYNAPLITIAGGNGSKPTWYIKFSGTSAKTYNLDSMLTTANYSTTLNPIYVNVSGDTMTGALNFANNVWNKLGDDVQFGDNNTAGAFCIQGLNGTTALKMTQYGGTNVGTISFDGSKFIASHYLSANVTFSDVTGILDSYDTRAETRTPQNTPRGLTVNFKQNSTYELSDGGTYIGLLSWRSYSSGSDLSGGQPIEIAYTQNGNLWTRMGTSATAWGGWNRIIKHSFLQERGLYKDYGYQTSSSIWPSMLAVNQFFSFTNWWDSGTYMPYIYGSGIMIPHLDANYRSFLYCQCSAAKVWVGFVNKSSTTSPTWRYLWAQGDSVTGAVWNDYAECRESDTEDLGYVLMETGKDSLTKTTERLSHFAGVSSDTWGFSQGETEKAKTPIAVAGRVLVYPYQDRNNYKPGDCVCAAPGGTVDIMTREEVILWPDRIVGTVSQVPDYDEWGGGEMSDRPAVKVNNRIWIKVK